MPMMVRVGSASLGGVPVTTAEGAGVGAADVSARSGSFLITWGPGAGLAFAATADGSITRVVPVVVGRALNSRRVARRSVLSACWVIPLRMVMVALACFGGFFPAGVGFFCVIGAGSFFWFKRMNHAAGKETSAVHPIISQRTTTGR